MKKFFALFLAMLLVLTLVACGDTKPAAEDAEQADGQTEEQTTTQDENTAEDSLVVDCEEIDLSNLELGVKEDGEDLILMAINDTPVGKVACRMTYDYDGDALTKVTCKYLCPDEATAIEAESAIKGEDGIDPASVQRDGKIVTCELLDSEIADFRGIPREQLVEVLKMMAETIS